MIIEFLLASVMTESIKQRYCSTKFCQKLGDNQTETIQKIQQAFGDEALSQAQIKKWFDCFKNSCQLRVRHTLAGHPQAETRR